MESQRSRICLAVNVLNVDDEKNLKGLTDVCICESVIIFSEYSLYRIRKRNKIKMCRVYILFEQLSFLETKIALYNKNKSKIKDLSYIALSIENSDILHN